MFIFVQSKEYSQSTLIMTEIVLKDKVITLTKDNLEVKRLPDKWFQSFFELFLIKAVLGAFIIMSIFVLMFMLRDIAVLFFQNIIMINLIFGIGQCSKYYKSRTIPLNQIKDADINRNNQLIITYTGNKRDMRQEINLPKNPSEREKVINQLQEVISIEEDDISELPLDSEKKMHRNNLYLGIVSFLLCFIFYYALPSINNDSFVLVMNTIILLFAIIAIIFSANRLLKIKKSPAPIVRNHEES